MSDSQHGFTLWYRNVDLNHKNSPSKYNISSLVDLVRDQSTMISNLFVFNNRCSPRTDWSPLLPDHL